MDKSLVNYLLKGEDTLERLNIKFFLSGIFSIIVLLLNTISTFSLKEYGLLILNIMFLILGTILLLETRYYIHILRAVIYMFAILSSFMNLNLLVVHFFEPTGFSLEYALVLLVTLGILLSLFGNILYPDSNILYKVFVVLHNITIFMLFAYLVYMMLILSTSYISVNSLQFYFLGFAYSSITVLTNTVIKYLKVYRRQCHVKKYKEYKS